MKTEWKTLVLIVAVLAACYFLPVGQQRFDNAVGEALRLVREYARQHVLLCLVPAFLIAGAVSVFVSQGSILKYLGPRASRPLAYGVASVSGAVLAVCSCTVMPLFAGIYRMGAGIGPATAFLYAGPAINVLAIILTARVLGPKLGLARAVGAVAFSVVIGLLMHLIFRKQQAQEAVAAAVMPQEQPARPLWKNAAVLTMMIVVLVVANWSVSGRLTVGIRCCPTGSDITEYIEGRVVAETDRSLTLELPSGLTKTYPKDWIGASRTVESPLYVAVYRARFFLAAAAAICLAVMLASWFSRGDLRDWIGSSWDFAKQILPLLLVGVLAAGLLAGRPGKEGLIPAEWIESAVGGNSLRANLLASVASAVMYFATLTEVPIVEGLRGAGMGDGPALAMLLAGPALSLPNMLVIGRVIGVRKTVVYVALVATMATISGCVYGALVA